MRQVDAIEIREKIRDKYGRTATLDGADGCGCGCCAGTQSLSDACAVETAGASSVAVGYSLEELGQAPEGADMGLGCGNPGAIAALSPGERVVDLGSGGGFDCILAARNVGDDGRVIGVDMTPEMVEKARRNALRSGMANLEFRLGEIENPPVGDGWADVVMSNCAINLSTNKPRVLEEAYRILRPGGRLAFADIVAVAELTEALRNDLEMYAACMSGAAHIDDFDRMLREAGFVDVAIRVKPEASSLLDGWFPGKNLGRWLTSAMIEATKPIRGEMR